MQLNTEVKDEVKALLKQLKPTRTHQESTVIIRGPRLEIQQQVPHRLIEIASESADSRAIVISALIRVLEKAKAKKRSGVAHQWLTAIDVLGRLRATEAIDVLTKSLDETDQRLTMVYMFHGPAVGALTRIGEPAIPRLMKALSNKRTSVRRAAAYTLGLIGGKEAERALRMALKKEKNEQVLHYIKSALPREGPRILPSFALERSEG